MCTLISVVKCNRQRSLGQKQLYLLSQETKLNWANLLVNWRPLKSPTPGQCLFKYFFSIP